MNYIYYKDAKGNFGDDLNAWLWPKFFGAAQANGDAFVGIGSILCKDSPLFKDLGQKRKIVFGTGVRPAYQAFKFDPSWDVKFLRGPFSASYFNNQHDYIADAAYALGLMEDYSEYVNTPKKYKVSVIPYFKSLEFFNWQAICNKLGYHYISPSAENGIAETLKEIAASEFVITEAMHGAIIADILRVPWSRFVLTTPYTEGSGVSEFKWMDWLHSIGQVQTDTTHIKLYRKSKVNSWVKNLTADMVNVEFLVKKVVRDQLVQQLGSIHNYSLSDDETIERVFSRMYEKAEEVKLSLNKEVYDRRTTV
ncbi:polysaccharide pyruvyl transferase family protein [Chitinophaga horti]|uniref:Polysaccharide pyruvyl transferase family protein n=1 Tax=Chitinophaga horti TaxID=2920382 RepID=A0ABY6IYU8_9BACT|nr:polysaccharide pyruvyl transferase family protein [Chitinophaga horti]UYQ92356.1 polysaccharide pyruvyl transferase family protein [Chitinophaga horti]